MALVDDETRLVRIRSSKRIAYLELSGSSDAQGIDLDTIWSLDIRLRPSSTSFGVENPNLIDLEKIRTPQASFLSSTIDKLMSTPDAGDLAIHFLFPSIFGFVARSDFLEQRLEYCTCVAEVKSFLEPLQEVGRVQRNTNIIAMLQHGISESMGAIVRSPTVSAEALGLELKNRLSFPWLLPQMISPRRIAWVQGREDIESIERALKAARALGIKIVVLDERGHWLQDPNSPWANLREDFVEVDITPDEAFATRVALAVRSYPKPIDGIVTISDVRLEGVAEACISQHLPTEPPSAYETAGDKGKTRMNECGGRTQLESFILESADQLDDFFPDHKEAGRSLSYPRVVKPVVGWCSDCVSKVHNRQELSVAVHKASDRHATAAKPSTRVVIEPYVDGPEVDANLVIWKDKILFCEINDDFPSPADMAGAGWRANFQETQNVMPSALPKDEIKALRDHLQDSIRRQGFESGVFHCEARVRNSRVEYGVQSGDAFHCRDLRPKVKTPQQAPEVYLHEINARPPGYLESLAVLLTYGVDYYGLRMLMAIGDVEDARIKALSQPFMNGAQFHLSVMIIQQDKKGVMKSADAAKEFLEKHGHMKEYVVDYYSRKRRGDVLEGPAATALWWIAYFSVISRVSREDLLEKVKYIQDNFDYELD